MSLLDKVAVTGASGMLGTAILDRFAGFCELYPTSRTRGLCGDRINWSLFDLLDQTSLVTWLTKHKPKIVIHCAAMIAVDECEKEPAVATTLHKDIVSLIASTISEWNGRLVYISTDAVFDGRLDRAYTEDDQPKPLNVYGRTKLLGEIATLNASSNNLVLRTTIFGWSRTGSRRSFAEWILDGLAKKLPLVMFNDVNFTPIHVGHVADIIYLILTFNPNLSGLFHLSGETELSKYEFAIKLANEFGLSTEGILPSSIDSANLIAVRSKNMTLSNAKLAVAMNKELPTVQSGLAYLKSQYESGWLEKIRSGT